MTRRHLISLPIALLAAASCVAPAAAATRHHKPTRRGAPAAVKVHLSISDAFSVDRQTVDVTGRPVHVTGTVHPFVPHQHVELRAYIGHTRVSSHRLHISRKGSDGRFAGTVVSSKPGVVRIAAEHRRSPRMMGFTVRHGMRAIAPDTHSPLFATLVQQQLAKLHFYMPRSGKWDLQTQLAIDAYHRLLHRGTSEDLDGRTLTDLLDGHGSFALRYPKDGRHAEGDLTHQLLALAEGPKVVAIYPISSGKSTTPTILGRYQVYRRTPGYLPDGMYYSDFFIRGYAIHGYEPAPDYPASHGCMRLPISDAISVFKWLNYGDWVDVYQ